MWSRQERTSLQSTIRRFERNFGMDQYDRAVASALSSQYPTMQCRKNYHCPGDKVFLPDGQPLRRLSTMLRWGAMGEAVDEQGHFGIFSDFVLFSCRAPDDDALVENTYWGMGALRVHRAQVLGLAQTPLAGDVMCLETATHVVNSETCTAFVNAEELHTLSEVQKMQFVYQVMRPLYVQDLPCLLRDLRDFIPYGERLLQRQLMESVVEHVDDVDDDPVRLWLRSHGLLRSHGSWQSLPREIKRHILYHVFSTVSAADLGDVDSTTAPHWGVALYPPTKTEPRFHLVGTYKGPLVFSLWLRKPNRGEWSYNIGEMWG